METDRSDGGIIISWVRWTSLINCGVALRRSAECLAHRCDLRSAGGFSYLKKRLGRGLRDFSPRFVV
jgi:hypothetical protein